MFAILIVFLVLALYLYGTRHYSYWKDRNVKYNKPLPFFGNNYEMYMQRANSTDLATAVYRQFPDEKIVGFYKGIKPELVVRDPDIIRHVLTADFKYFSDRNLGRDLETEPMLKNLFSGNGDLWKLLRQRLTPAFTSGKLRNMFPLIVECSEQLQLLADQISERGQVCDVRDLIARFTTDVIGACGFGIKMNSIGDASSKFRNIGKKMFIDSFGASLKIFLKELFPNACKSLKPFDKSLEDDLVDLVRSISEQRNGEPVGRNDFIDLLLELNKQGKIVSESLHEVNSDGTPKKIEQEMDLTLIAAQCFVFFGAGFETSSSASSFTLHELAHNPQVQEKVQIEIDTVLAKYNGKICYDAVKEMTYLECTFKEGLRKFPSLGVLNRACTKKYQIPGSNVWIDKGITVVIPVFALHNDGKHFENPDQFNPDRFLAESIQKIHKFTYLPFGEGPRACIGPRLGLMQSMTALATLLSRHSVAPAPGAPRHLVANPCSNIVQSVVGGVPLILSRRRM